MHLCKLRTLKPLPTLQEKANKYVQNIHRENVWIHLYILWLIIWHVYIVNSIVCVDGLVLVLLVRSFVHMSRHNDSDQVVWLSKVA